MAPQTRRRRPPIPAPDKSGLAHPKKVAADSGLVLNPLARDPYRLLFGMDASLGCSSPAGPTARGMWFMHTWLEGPPGALRAGTPLPYTSAWERGSRCSYLQSRSFRSVELPCACATEIASASPGVLLAAMAWIRRRVLFDSRILMEGIR
jgi:hypothetical protein